MSKFSLKEFPNAYLSSDQQIDFVSENGTTDFKNYEYNESTLLVQFIKNSVGLNENEITDVAFSFFDNKNIEIINKTIVLYIFEKSNKKVLVPFQSKDDLLVVMRTVFLRDAKNNKKNIKCQVDELNSIVLKEIMPSIITNVEQYINYIKEINSIEKQERKINDLPVSTKINRGSIELPAMTDAYFKEPDVKIIRKKSKPSKSKDLIKKIKDEIEKSEKIAQNLDLDEKKLSDAIKSNMMSKRNIASKRSSLRDNLIKLQEENEEEIFLGEDIDFWNKLKI